MMKIQINEVFNLVCSLDLQISWVQKTGHSQKHEGYHHVKNPSPSYFSGIDSATRHVWWQCSPAHIPAGIFFLLFCSAN